MYFRKIVNIVINEKLYCKDEVEELCRQAYREGHAYGVGGNFLFKQTHLKENEWVNKNLKH